MFTLSLPFALLSLSVLQCRAAPRMAPRADAPTPLAAIDPYLYGCNDTEKSMIQEAWREAATLANYHYEWIPGGKWQPAMDLYIGPKSKDDWSFWFGPGELEKNIRRQYYVHYGIFGDAPRNTYGYFYCHEDKLPEKKKKKEPECGPNTTAWTFDDLGTLWSAHYVVLCPTWWSDRMKSLADVTKEANGDPEMQRTINKWRKARARSLFHESYHWKDTVSQPRCDLSPEVYQPQPVVDLAKKDLNKAKINAESWAQAALAIYIQKEFKTDGPPVPEGYKGDEETLEEKMIDMPDWFDAPVKQGAEKFEPPESPDLFQLGQMGVLTAYTQPSCGGDGYVDEDQCKSFCSQGKCSEMEVPEGTEGEIHFKKWKCDGCPTGECKAGKYKDFNECSFNCGQGMCSEKAGVDGVECICP